MVNMVVVIVYNLVTKCRLGLGKEEVYTDHSNPNGPMRTGVETDEYTHKALATGDPEFGVKKPSWVSVVPEYNVIEET